jgi:hypothetical protein
MSTRSSFHKYCNFCILFQSFGTFLFYFRLQLTWLILACRDHRFTLLFLFFSFHGCEPRESVWSPGSMDPFFKIYLIYTL